MHMYIDIYIHICIYAYAHTYPYVHHFCRAYIHTKTLGPRYHIMF